MTALDYSIMFYMKRILALLVLFSACNAVVAREVNTEIRVIRGHDYIIAWISGSGSEGGSMLDADDGVGVSIIHAASCDHTNHIISTQIEKE